MGMFPVAARATLHHWEEPCISGTRGTGAVFFSGCTLGCSYCRNAPISHGGLGKALPVQALADVFRRLVDGESALSLSPVSPTHFIPAIIVALDIYQPPVPVVYNCGGYESPGTIRQLDGLVDVFLPNFKHVSARLSQLLAHARDYANAAIPAIKEMCRQTGSAEYNAQGIMTRGTLIRRLVLPGCTGGSLQVLDTNRHHFPVGTGVSLMSQYTPQPGCATPG
ncbi:MAG: radical SAM protein [Eubacteriales bacterium]|nr:radical SAM protein [Eubacteriales bacterium]